MATNPTTDFCPYKGLAPYTQRDRNYFFGRERDQEIIISNLYASHLTVLYGASGVGKSSVLLAGVVPSLHMEARIAVVVFRSWQSASFIQALKNDVLEVVAEKTIGTDDAEASNIDQSLPLDEFLSQAARKIHGPIFLIFDQFEEYFLYHPLHADAEAFESQFAKAVNRRDVDVNFLLSLREDGLSKLDRFQGRIPTLLSNMLRLEHLDRMSARDAITKPIDVYNRIAENGNLMTIEGALVDELLHDLSTLRVAGGQAGQGEVSGDGYRPANANVSIETPCLQMVLTRLWEVEKASNSNTLRVETFVKLGRAESIARTHLDQLMEKLTEEERISAARVLHYLVTPSGSKIAQEPAALVSWAQLKEEEVNSILQRLVAPDTRILRTVQVPGQPVRYEIFHDVLAAAVLDWRRRFDEKQTQEAVRRQEQERLQQKQEELARQREIDEARRLRKRMTILTLLLAITIGSTVLSVFQWFKARRATRHAQSSEIAAHASATLATDPELSLLLAIEAAKVSPTAEAKRALIDGLLQAHTEFILQNKGGVRSAAFSSDGSLVATAAQLDKVKVWDTKTGALKTELSSQDDPERFKRGARHVAFSPDGKYLVAVNWEGATARVWAVSNWEPVALLKVASLAGVDDKDVTVYNVVFSPDSSRLITTTDDVSPQVWRVGTWDQEAVLQGVKKEPPPVDATKSTTSTTPTTATTATTRVSSADAVEQAAPRGHTSSVYCVAFSPDGKYVVTGGRGNVAWVWEVGTWQPKVRLSGHSSPIYGVGFSRDGKFVVTASYDRTARVWNATTGQSINNLGHPDAVYDASFSPVSDDIVTACWDNEVRIWKRGVDKLNGAPLWTVAGEFRGHTNWVYSSQFGPAGTFIVSGSEDKTARIWRTTDPMILPDSVNALLEIARTRVKRTLTPEERKKYVGN